MYCTVQLPASCHPQPTTKTNGPQRYDNQTCNESTRNKLILNTSQHIRHTPRLPPSSPNSPRLSYDTWPPQPTDKVLDVGCGDGKFTENFLPEVQSVLGIDASPAMIESANKDYSSPKTEFRVVDCRYLEKEETIVDGSWDRV